MIFKVNDVTILSILLIYCVAARPIQCAFFDWFSSSDNAENQEVVPVINIPFEAKSEDEKFLDEALKFTDIMKSSGLDVCQHSVVLKIKTSCGSMNEEDLAKMSVNLLNCQSAVDGRKIFPCSEDMTLKQCTETMDVHMWNAYHMMNNRARAVCLSARRAQFQALSEMTVNKLIATSQDQVNRMTSLLSKQEELEELTAKTLGDVREGNVNIMIQQENLKNSQTALKESVFQNLQELSRENSLIAAGNKELDNIKRKLDETNKELTIQSLERAGYFQHVIKDIELVQEQIASVYKRIDESSNKLLAHHIQASKQFEETIQNLHKINATISYLAKIFSTTHQQLEERIEWIKLYLGESGEELSKILSAVLHLAYLLMGMLIASFLKLPLIARAALILILPFNLLLVYERKIDLALDFSQITLILTVITTVNIVVNGILSYVAPAKPKYYLKDGSVNNKVPATNGSATVHAKEPSSLSKIVAAFKFCIHSFTQLLGSLWTSGANEEPLRTPTANISAVSHTSRHPRDNDATLLHAETPFYNKINGGVYSRVSHWLDNSEFPARPRTPMSTGSARSSVIRNSCGAMCRNGRPCRNPSTPGREYCRVHQDGSSVVG